MERKKKIPMVFYDDEVCGFQLVFLLTNCIASLKHIPVNNETTVAFKSHHRCNSER